MVTATAAVTDGGRDVTAVHADANDPTVDSFEGFFEAQFPPLAGYVLRLTRDEQLARDVAQEALVRLFSRWRSVHEPRAWVYLVATNLVRDHWARSHRHAGALSLLHRSAVAEVAGPDRTVRDAVERLPARLRTTVLLHYFADLPIETVAALTERPVGTVKQRLHEARKSLAETLGADHE